MMRSWYVLIFDVMLLLCFSCGLFVCRGVFGVMVGRLLWMSSVMFLIIV